MNARIEVRTLSASKWLETDSQRSINAAAIGGQTLIAYGIAERLSRPLREDDRPREEICFPQVVGVVCSGDKGSGADIQLRGWCTSFVTTQLGRRKRDRF